MLPGNEIKQIHLINLYYVMIKRKKKYNFESDTWNLIVLKMMSTTFLLETVHSLMEAQSHQYSSHFLFIFFEPCILIFHASYVLIKKYNLKSFC